MRSITDVKAVGSYDCPLTVTSSCDNLICAAAKTYEKGHNSAQITDAIAK